MDINKTNITTKTYSIESDVYKNFYIDIVDTGTTYESWIYNTSYGTKHFILGADKEQQSYDEFLEAATNNLDWDINYVLSLYRSLDGCNCDIL